MLFHESNNTVLAVNILTGIRSPRHVQASDSLACIENKLHAAVTLSFLPIEVVLKCNIGLLLLAHQL